MRVIYCFFLKHELVPGFSISDGSKMIKDTRLYMHEQRSVWLDVDDHVIVNIQPHASLFMQSGVIPGYTLQQVGGQLADGKANLAHTVALAYCDRRIFQRLEIDGDAERRTDLVLPAIAATNIGHIVILGYDQ